MVKQNSFSNAELGPATSRRREAPVTWIAVAACAASLAVYLVLHARELRLIGEWLSFE